MSRRLLSGKGLFHHAAAAGNPAGPNCVLLLHCDGTDGSTTFTDGSGKGHAVTAHGAAALSAAQYKFGNSSAFLDGSTAWLTLDGSSDFTLNGDFTIDLRCYSTDPVLHADVLFSWMPDSGGGAFYVSTYNGNISYSNPSGSPIVSDAGLIVLNTWTHIAMTRASGTVYIFVNGSVVGSAADSNVYNCPSDGFAIGSLRPNTKSLPWMGYFDEIRVLNGRAAWTANFTPPSAPYTDPPPQAGPNCVLLLHCDGTNGSTTFTDSSGKGHVMTAHSGAAVGTSQAKFGGASCNCGATGWLTGDNSADLSFGTGDFTIDFWVYFTNLLSGVPYYIFQAQSHTVDAYVRDGTFTVELGVGAAINMSGGVAVVNTWTHFALVRSAGTTIFFINGVQAGSVADSTNYAGAAGNPVFGAAKSNGASPLNGDLDEIRILAGRAAWTANFTPPAAPYTDPPPQAGPNCVLLLHCDGTNGSTSFPDSSGQGHVITANAGAVVGASQFKFGGSSCNLGATGYLTGDNSSDVTFGTSDFTIDFWVYFNDPSGFLYLFTASNSSLDAYVYSGTFTVELGTSGSIYFSGGTAVVGTWMHFALVRASGVTTLYINGISVGSAPDPTDYPGQGGNPVFGAGNATGAYPMNGVLDEIRVLNGRAAWTANFTPPAAPYT